MTGSLRSFGIISTTIWQSEKFIGLNDNAARLVYIWLHTSYKTCAGVLRVGPAHLLEETSLVETLRSARDIFRELERAGLICWFKPYVVLNNYLKFNPVKTHRHAIGAYMEALALPDGKHKNRIINELCRHSGSRDLVKWRNKDGKPHDVLFMIGEYLDETSDLANNSSPLQNPSDRVSEPLGRPLAISKNAIKKVECGDRPQPSDETTDNNVEEPRKFQSGKPRPETIASAKRMGTIN